MFILYFMNWGFTLWRIATGVALGVPQQREEEDEEAKEKARQEHETLYGLSEAQRKKREQEQSDENGQSA
jgi:hypothetical protein